MTLEELRAALPEEFRVTPDNMPADVAEAIEFLAYRDVLVEAGTAVADLPTIAEWRR